MSPAWRGALARSLAARVVFCDGARDLGVVFERQETTKPRNLFKRFRGCLSSGSRIRTDDLRVMSPTSYLAAPSRITLCPSASKGRGTLKVLIFLSTVFLKIFMQNFQERPRSSPKPSKIVPKRYTTGQEFTSGIKGFGASNTYSFGAPLWQKHPPSSNASTQPSTRTPPTWMPCGRT